jgi:hypothetical protein
VGLVFDINEWDDYALEEAVRIKEKLGGTVTAITIGPKTQIPPKKVPSPRRRHSHTPNRPEI